MKLKEFQRELIKNKLDGAVLFFKDPNFFYFAQQEVDNSILFIPSRRKSTIFISKLDDIKSSMKKIVYKDPYKNLKEFLKSQKVKKVGINESKVSIAQKRKLSRFVKTKDVEKIILGLRKTKTKEEIEKIKKACSLTEKVLKKIIKNFYFKTEKEVKDFIKIEAIKLDCELSFEPIVASGKNASTPHYSGNQRIKKGFLVIDMGLKYKGYCADITRTIYFGNPREEELDIYNTLLKIQKKVVSYIKTGFDIKELEKTVRNELKKDEKYFIHNLGHGLGIEVHEQPAVNAKSKEKLEEGTVITIEPGIYSSYGIRIEDDVLVTSKGHRLLTKFPKELIIIPKV
ncbi:aminopeptidase P family protein [Candidatus Woesearchaeota archaeon]|nr:aminopeptidase P family protein [Candidatus Woesearchaeota archaeon]